LKARAVLVRCTPHLHFAAELAVFGAEAQTRLRTVLAICLRPSLRFGYIGTQNGSDARFSISVFFQGVRRERTTQAGKKSMAGLAGAAGPLLTQVNEFRASHPRVDLFNNPPI